MPKMNLKTLAYNAIRQKIVTCEYAPGTFINEEFLTSELNLSRTPIRDALGRLEQEGLVEIRPKRGIIVKPLTVNDINMIFEVRNIYEPYILLNYGSLIPTEKLQGFYDIFIKRDPENEYFRVHDYFYELDARFHALIVDACPNTYIRQNYYLIQTQDERFRHMTGEVDNTRLEDTFKEHMAIVRPCLQNDWNAAAQAMTDHLEQSKNSMFRLIFNGTEKSRFSF